MGNLSGKACCMQQLSLLLLLFLNKTCLSPLLSYLEKHSNLMLCLNGYPIFFQEQRGPQCKIKQLIQNIFEDKFSSENFILMCHTFCFCFVHYYYSAYGISNYHKRMLLLPIFPSSSSARFEGSFIKRSLNFKLRCVSCFE